MKAGPKTSAYLDCSRASLALAVERLRAGGFRAQDVWLVFAGAGTHELGHEINSKAPEGASTRAAGPAVASGRSPRSNASSSPRELGQSSIRTCSTAAS